MKKLIIVTFTIVLFQNSIYGQIENWDFEMNFFPSIGYRIISGENKDLISNYHRISMTNSFGINAFYHLKPNTSIGTGLNYDEYGMNTAIEDEGYEFKETGYIKYKFINLPILYTKYTSNTAFFRLGINNNFMVKSIDYHNVELPESSERTEVLNFSDIRNSEYLRVYHPSLRISYGFEKSIGENFTFIFEPTINTMLLRNNKGRSSSINIRYFNAGVILGLKLGGKKNTIANTL